MTIQNDVVWTKIDISRGADSGNSGNSGQAGETPSVAADQAIKPEKAPAELVPTGVTGVEADAATRLKASRARLRHALIPPDIIRHDRPSLQKVIAHAWAGTWGPPNGAWRVAAKIDAVFLGIPLVTLGYSFAWVGERPSRRFCAALLTGSIVWLLITLGWL